jgi:hypothetical protein
MFAVILGVALFFIALSINRHLKAIREDTTLKNRVERISRFEDNLQSISNRLGYLSKQLERAGYR